MRSWPPLLPAVMTRHLLFLFVFVLCLLQTYAAPTRTSFIRKSKDNQPFSGPPEVETNETLPTNGGVLEELCVIKFTAILVGGMNLVREDKECEIRFMPSGSSSSSTQDGGGSTSSSNSSGSESSGNDTDCASASTTLFSSTGTGSTATNTDSATDTGSATNTGSIASSTNSIAQPIVIPPASATSQSGASNGQTSLPTQSPNPITVGQTIAPAAPTNGAISVVSAGVVPATAIQSFTPSPTIAGANGATQAQDTAPSTSAAVQLPGNQLQVLPIGLGVFAGISVIALIVVGLVTYERTKYRRAFRQRRLAAAGAEMGYGGNGMSERR